jgi:hypothetical protein
MLVLNLIEYTCYRYTTRAINIIYATVSYFRFFLHQSSPSESSSLSESTHPLPAGDFGATGNNVECVSITQTTLLQVHSASFHIRVHATFGNTSHYRVNFCQDHPSLHRRPPKWKNLWVLCLIRRTTTRMNRPDDADTAAHYKGDAGPS